jgi:hypothetical protein
MTPSEIITQIARLSTGESIPDTNFTAIILGYVNRAYEDIYTSLCDLDYVRLQATQTVTVTSGTGTLAPEPFRIHSVVDTTNDRLLLPRHPLIIEEYDPDLDDTGSPAHYYLASATSLKVHPSASITARVRYTPKITPLTSTGTENSIKFHKEYHELLIWGGLIRLSYDERDLRNPSEIAFVIQQYAETKARLLQNANSDAREPLRVPYRDF